MKMTLFQIGKKKFLLEFIRDLFYDINMIFAKIIDIDQNIV